MNFPQRQKWQKAKSEAQELNCGTLKADVVTDTEQWSDELMKGCDLAELLGSSDVGPIVTDEPFQQFGQVSMDHLCFHQCQLTFWVTANPQPTMMKEKDETSVEISTAK